jgi:hypothetical protein
MTRISLGDREQRDARSLGLLRGSLGIQHAGIIVAIREHDHAFLPVRAPISSVTRVSASKSAVPPAARVRITARFAAALSRVKSCSRSSVVLKPQIAIESWSRYFYHSALGAKYRFLRIGRSG